MSILGVKVDENRFYCSYDDDCWICLAQAMMEIYTSSYINAIPTTAMSQSEYDKLDRSSYLPIRRSVLKNIKYGPLRNAMNIQSIYYGLEARRKDRMRKLGIVWKDNYNEDLTKL